MKQSLYFFAAYSFAKSAFLTVALFFCTGIFVLQAQVIYVTPSGAGTQTGASWANAAPGSQLQTKINGAAANTQLWVAAGTYKPNAYPAGCSDCNGSRDYAFLLKSDVALYGGFAGTETDISQRNFKTNATILSGDIGTLNNSSDNCYHVVISIGNSVATVLDGFTITGGNAIEDGTQTFATISGTQTPRYNAGGVYAENSSLKIANCVLTSNSGTIGSSAIEGYYSPLEINNCIFNNNSGIAALAIIYTSSTVTNCIFTGNVSSRNFFNSSSAVYNFSSSSVFTNCTFTANSSPVATMNNYYASPVVTNCIFWNNTGSSITNNNGAASVNYSNIQGGYGGTGNLNTDPLFTSAGDPDGADNIFGTPDDGLKLQLSSPAVNAGQNAAVPANTITDITGAARIQQTWVDMGAYETSYSNCKPTLNKLIYVDGSVAVSGSGDTWGTAFKELRDAMKAANQCTTIDTILVAKGTYKPTNDTNQDSAFTFLNGGFKIFGGYPTGGGNRDTAANHTILSGDIGTTGTSTDNSYHVVVIAGLSSSADSLVLDDLTITGGNANGAGSKMYNGTTLYQSEGAGLYLHSNNGAGGKIAVRNCTFTANNATSYGGGFYNQLSSPTVFNCVLKNNTAGSGGGMFNYNASAPGIRNCSFTGNTATGDGGGMLNLQCSPIIDKCIFSDNIANTINSSRGGGMCNNNASPVIKNTVFTSNYGNYGGGLHIFNSSSPQISNCVITNNRASFGGGIYASDNYSSPVFTNCTITGNIADFYGQGITVRNNSHSYFRNSIIYNNDVNVDGITTATAYASYCITSLLGTGNINANPLFNNAADPDGPDNIWGTADDGFHLQAASPALNTGSNAAVPAGTTTDITGAARIQNGVTDMGAYENFYCRTGNALYVDASNTNSGNGNSWATAYQELRDALYDAGQCSNISTIYVAKGTYLPTSDANRDSAFTILRGGLKIYGGYPTGGGTRNVAANTTILSGDIGTSGNSTDNSYHVLVLAGIDNSADSVVLDGCTLSNGTAGGSGTKLYNGQNTDRSNGGGLYLLNNAAGSKIVIRNCSFTNNTGSNGGAVYNEASSPVFSNSNFAGNVAANQGGAVYVYDHASPAFNHCFFRQNNAQDGGAIAVFFYSPYSVNDCVFVQNNASERGGALYVVNNCPATLTNCTLVQNNALYGGAMSFNASSNTSIINAIAWGNTATAYPLFFNNAFVTVNYSLVQGGYTGTGNISSDPLFINSANVAGADNIFGTADDGLRLQAGSPAINTGSNAAVPAGVTTDITGAARIQDGTVDMGAYEGSVCPSFTTLYVDSSIASPGKGSSWATAFKTVQQALDAANSCSGVKQVWIKKGTYYPTAYPANCTDCAANGTARDYTFTLRDGLALYGGFAGTETDTAQRVAGNITTLSGDIGTPGSNSDNCYHVLLAINSSNRLNGLTVTGGNANDNGAITVAGQTIYHSNGGGMYQYATSSALYNCTFTGNTASSEGGGMYNAYCSALRIRNSRYLNNHSGSGGAIRLLYGNTSFVSVNSVYAGNTASSNDAGALSLVMGSGTDTLINNAFIKNVASGNAANNGGGAIVQESGSSSYIVNNTFYADSAASNGGAIWFKSGGSNRYVYNNIFYKSYNGTASTDISMDGITTITAQGNNLYSNTNPLFINELNPAGADNIFGTADDGLAPQSCSPAVNGGSNVAGNQPADIAGQLRIFNGTTDIGAYEYQAIAEGSSLALNGDNGSYNIQAGVNALLIPGCRIIAHLLPNGANPLSGTLSAKIWIDNTQPVYGGKTFVKRHYELTPVANAATASARITLYATQDEFNAFNITPYNGSNLPTGPGDFGGIANLRIVKFSGQSSNGTGLPGTYSQAGMEIDPDDNNIVWNNLLSRWEISLNVTGFSGFFISNNSGILPLTLLQFNGKGINDKDALLTWRTANEINTSHFELQRSSDGRRFTTVATLQAKGTAQSETEYNYTDRNLEAGVYYYRLQMVDKDGKETYSAVVTVTLKTSGTISLYPVPAKDILWLSGSTANLLGKQALLIDVQGRVIQTIRISQWPQRIDILNLAPGTYLIKTDGEKGLPFIKQ